MEIAERISSSEERWEDAEARRLAAMVEISQALADALHLNASMPKVLQILERHPSIACAGFLLISEEGSSSRIRAQSSSENGGIFDRSSRLLSQAAESGRPIVVPKMSLEPSVRKRRGRGELSLLCVPCAIGRRTVGVLLAELHFDPARNYERALKFFRLVGTMISQSLKISLLVEEEKRNLLEENTHLREELRERYGFSNIIGNSRAMQEVYKKVSQVAPAPTTVLLRGESGTGKELIAHAIHYNSLRARQPLVRINCAALPETLIESELFGHERGAFTGAEAQRKGRFELAQGGTLFLDEIGDLQPSLQVKLLRVLQEKEFERVGGTRTLGVDVRLIAATNKDLEKGIQEGSFREDLYYRLNVFSIYVPPLRERKSDVLLLADHFLEKYSQTHGKIIRRLSTPAIDMLTSYHWPGNVRELENAMERAVLVCEGPVIYGHHLPPSLQTAEASGTQVRASLEEAVAAFEKDLIVDALKSARGNRAKAARLLHTTERIIGYKTKKFGIDVDRFRK